VPYKDSTDLIVILSEAKNLSSISVQAKKHGGVLRFAQNDNVSDFSGGFEACAAQNHHFQS
jgi:hypothetical protein